MASKLRSTPRDGGRRDVTASTFSRTVHTVHVDLADLLSAYDVTDEVILMVETPSGRAKRVHLGGNFLVPTHDEFAGYGTCDRCGSVNIAVTADRLCRDCR